MLAFRKGYKMADRRFAVPFLKGRRDDNGGRERRLAVYDRGRDV